ncbi:MAG: hypothetical protein DRN29_10280, partial [Thermoplasmata archaeon]
SEKIMAEMILSLLKEKEEGEGLTEEEEKAKKNLECEVLRWLDERIKDSETTITLLEKEL